MADLTIDHRKAARCILGTGANLTEKEGQFLGGMAFRSEPLTERQARWLDILVKRHGLPEWNLLAEGGEHE
ncbi:MAG: hypothetical protein CGW95_15480 [Phenylobacterium zucineum]|nr:MAG: hypothetical protein CGW95_15480 [Phenylobacterium zucineum]